MTFNPYLIARTILEILFVFFVIFIQALTITLYWNLYIGPVLDLKLLRMSEIMGPVILFNLMISGQIWFGFKENSIKSIGTRNWQTRLTYCERVIFDWLIALVIGITFYLSNVESVAF